MLERLLSWPVVTLVSFLVLKKPIISLLNRVHTLKAGREGFSLDAFVIDAATIQAATKVESGLSSTEGQEKLKIAMSIGISASVQHREERIRNDLRNMKLDIPQQETIDLLIRTLAFFQAVATAEAIYRTIFGSQITLLKILNARHVAARTEFEPVYVSAKMNFPEFYTGYSFQQWLNYLLSRGLLSTNDNEQFSITTDGKEFLKWMTEESLPENKPF